MRQGIIALMCACACAYTCSHDHAHVCMHIKAELRLCINNICVVMIAFNCACAYSVQAWLRLCIHVRVGMMVPIYDCAYVCIYAGHYRACVIMCVREQAQLVVHMRVGMIAPMCAYSYRHDHEKYVHTRAGMIMPMFAYTRGHDHVNVCEPREHDHVNVCEPREHDHVNVCEPREHDLAYVYRRERVSMIVSMYTTHKRVHAHTCMYIHISLFMPTRVCTYT